METYVFSGMAGVFNDACKGGRFQPAVAKNSRPASRRQPVFSFARRRLTGTYPGNIIVGHIGGRSSDERDAFLATAEPCFLAALFSAARCFLSARFRSARCLSASYVFEHPCHTSKTAHSHRTGLAKSHTPPPLVSPCLCTILRWPTWELLSAAAMRRRFLSSREDDRVLGRFLWDFHICLCQTRASSPPVTAIAAQILRGQTDFRTGTI